MSAGPSRPAAIPSARSCQAENAGAVPPARATIVFPAPVASLSVRRMSSGEEGADAGELAVALVSKQPRGFRRHAALDYLSPLAYEQRELAPVCAGRGKPSTKPGQVHSRLRASCSALPEAPPSRDATADVCPHRPWPERSRPAHRLVPGVITSRHPIDRAPGSALLPSLPTRAANYDGARWPGAVALP